MSKKYLVSFLILIFLISGCSNNNSESNSDDEKIFNLGLVTSSSDQRVEALNEFADSVEEETNGEIKINIHADGALGTEDEVGVQVQSGSTQMVLMGGLARFEQFDKSMVVDELPFLFDNHQDAYDAMDGKVGDILKEKAEDKGLKILAFWENGFRNFTNNEKPIETPEDLKGLKMRVSESNFRVKMFESIGAKVTPMDFSELYSALQQGVIDGQENPVSIINSSKLYEVQEYLSISHHLWGANPFVINLDLWDSLSPDEQKILEKNALKYQDIQRKSLSDSEDKLIEELKEKGMKVNEVNTDEFKKAVQPILDDAEEQFGKEMMDALEEYR